MKQDSEAKFLTLTGHAAGINEFAWSFDDSFFATAGDDSAILLWDGHRGELLHRCKEHKGGVISLAWHPEFAIFASGSRDGAVFLWDGQSGDLLSKVIIVGPEVHCIRWSSDGTMLAVATADPIISLWRYGSEGFELAGKLSGHSSGVMGLAWKPGALILASGAQDKTIRLWDVATAENTHVIEEHEDVVNRVAWSPDGSLLASGSDDCTIRIRSSETRQLINHLEGSGGYVRGLAFSPDGTMLAGASWDGTTRLWNVQHWSIMEIVESSYNVLGGVAFGADSLKWAVLGEGNDNVQIRPLVGAVPGSKREHRFFKSLHLTDVRCLADIHLDFVTDEQAIRTWTLLLGENGCGKTTVLRCVALLLVGSEGFLELLGEPGDWIRIGSDRCRLQAELTTDSGTRLVVLVIKAGRTPTEVLEDNRSVLKIIDQGLRKGGELYPLFGYGCSRRMNRATPSPGDDPGTFRSERAQNVATLFSPDALLYPLRKLAVDLDYNDPKNCQRVLGEILRNLLPGMHFKRVDKQLRDIVFETEDGEIPLSRLSDGYQNMAAWCGDLFYRLIKSHSDPSDLMKRYGLILIDEIDLHLHPVWQRRLRRFIEKTLPNFQIIASTHSPLTAQQADKDELYILSRPAEGQAPQLHPYPGVPKHMLVQQLLVGPAFGVDTVHEEEVFGMRERYRVLRDNKERTPKEDEELLELSKRLKEMNTSPMSELFGLTDTLAKLRNLTGEADA